MITLRNLTRKYGEVVAVNDVSTHIGQGEIVGLLGHNGAGKTTVMKMLTGYLEPSAGSITIQGFDALTQRQQVQKLIGYLPENAPTYPEMLVQDYLAMMAELRGVAPNAIKAAVVEAARATDLLDRLTQPIANLSKGLRQRVGIAQAIVHKPAVLILDEPTNGLDPAQIQGIRALIRRLGEHTTILLSTHILQEVEAVCSRVLVMIGGRLAADAPLSKLVGSSAVTLSVPDDTAIDLGATPIAGVQRADRVGQDPRLPGYVQWRLACAESEYPVAEVVEAAARHGWRIGAVAPESRSLEQVFQQLEREHMVRREESSP